MTRILITGASGSGAFWLIKYIRESFPEAKIYGTSRKSHIENPPEGVEFLKMDLLDYPSVHRAIQHAIPNLIFHFASDPDKGWSTPVTAIQNPAVGTANLFHIVWNFWKTARIINISSAEIYGDTYGREEPLDEGAPKNPLSPYAIGKLAQDNLGLLYVRAYGLDIVTLRCFSYINPRHKTLFTSVMAKQIAEIEAGKRDKIRHGDLSSKRCWVDCWDLAKAIWLASQKCDGGQAYNIGGDSILSMEQILGKLRFLSYVTIDCEKDENLLRPADISLQIPNTKKFRDKTGWKPEIDIKDSLSYLLDYYRKEVAKG